MDFEKITHTDDLFLVREIVDSLPLGVMVIDHAFDVQYMNQRFQEIFDPSPSQLLPMDGGPPPSCMGHIFGCRYSGTVDYAEGRGPADIVNFVSPLTPCHRLLQRKSTPRKINIRW